MIQTDFTFTEQTKNARRGRNDDEFLNVLYFSFSSGLIRLTGHQFSLIDLHKILLQTILFASYYKTSLRKVNDNDNFRFLHFSGSWTDRSMTLVGASTSSSLSVSLLLNSYLHLSRLNNQMRIKRFGSNQNVEQEQEINA